METGIARSKKGGEKRKLFGALVTFVVDKTFVIFAIKLNSGHISTRKPTNKYCQKKKYRVQQCVR